jgi:hypothetical protein
MNWTDLFYNDTIILYKLILFYFTDKAPSIWDEYFHDKRIVVSNPEAVKLTPRKKTSNFHKGTDVLAIDPSRGFSIVNGDIACDSYNKLDEDINNLVELGVRTSKLLS